MPNSTDESLNETPKPSRGPIRLSAFVFPGAGQLVQRRWIPAVIFGTGFTACFVVFLIYAIKIILAFYAIPIEFNNYQEVKIPKFGAVFSFFLAMLVYTVSLIDTYKAYRRACMNWTRRKLPDIAA